MRIAVNTRFLLKNKLEGIGWFTYESLKRIVQTHPEHDFIFFFDRPFADEFVFGKNVTPVVLFPPARHPFLWYWWFQISVTRALRKYNPDMFLSTDGYLSLNTNVKQLLVVHDLAFEHFNGHLDWLTQKYYRYYTPRFTKKAKRIVTVSEFTKNDIVQRYKIAPEKIDVVYNGSNPRFQPLTEPAKEEVRRKYTNGSKYFMYAGAIHPRKNISRLFQAFDDFKKDDSTGIKLVIAGRKAWETDETMQVYNRMNHKDEVVFLGHLEQSELVSVTGAAEAMVYISLLEGFGIPIVEAMSCDVPVITSNISSMPEVAGDAGILVDPYSVNAITEAMKKISSDTTLRHSLIEKGRVQQKKFSWKKTGDQLWESMMKGLHS